MLKVYGVHGSPFVRKVLIALDIKGIEFEMVKQMPFTPDPEYQKINPLGKIPTLVDGDLTLGDSKVICKYLEEAYPDPALYPQAVNDRAKAYWFEDLCAGRVAELAAGIFFQRFMRPRAFKQDPDEELIARIIEKDLPPLQDYLEAEIPDEGFIFGEFMMADLSIVSPFITASYAAYEVDASRWPSLAGLISRVKKVPQVKSVLIKEARALKLG